MIKSLKAIILTTILFSGGMTIMTSCGSDNSSPKNSRKVSSRVVDQNAYGLGAEHARQLLENVGSEDRVQDGLLEVRARMSNIESKFGRQSSVDYERGFTDYIKENCDSLAQIIF